MWVRFCVLWLSICLLSPAAMACAAACQRVITVGGDVTEILYALGAETQLVGSDTTSYYPEAAAALPKVGYQRTLPLEGMLSLSPDCIIAGAQAGPKGMLEHIQTLGVRVETIEAEDTAEGVYQKMRQIGHAIGKETEAEELINTLQAKYADALPESSKRFVFLMSHGGGHMVMAGSDTAAASLGKYANVPYAVEAFTGYKPVNAEAMLLVNPDVIVVAEKALEEMGGIEALQAMPAIAMTTAGKNGAILPVDPVAFLGFGPRMFESAATLSAFMRDM